LACELHSGSCQSSRRPIYEGQHLVLYFIKHTSNQEKIPIRTTDLFICILLFCTVSKSCGSAVSIMTGYGLTNQGVRVWVPVGTRILTSPYCPDWLWDPPSLLSSGYLGIFTQGKATRTWSWPLISNYCQGQ
jgi:hypothetical protein